MSTKLGINKRIKEFYELYKQGAVTLDTSCIEDFFDIDKHRKEKVSVETVKSTIEFLDVDSLINDKEYGSVSVLLTDFYSSISELSKITDDASTYDELNIIKAYLTKDANMVYLNIEYEPEARMETDGEVIVRLKNTVMRLYEQEELKKKKIDNFINGLSASELIELKNRIKTLEE